jgi:HEAT repeat protein
VDCVLALTPDPVLEKTLEYHSPGWLTVAPAQAEYAPGQRVLLPLGGLSCQAETMALFEHDYLDLRRKREILWSHAESHATRGPLLVLGCDPGDEVLRRILYQLRPVPPHRQAGWLLCRQVSIRDRELWDALGFQVVEGPPASLLRQLVRAANQVIPMAGTRPTYKSGRTSPYKHLNYFERDETAIFFGRAAETQQLVDLVCAHRLTVLTGASGAGKTSLINAGLLAWTDRTPGQVGVYARCGNDPVTAIAHAVAQRLEFDFDRDDETLTTFLGRVRDKACAVPILVLDQAEELFTRIGEVQQDELVRALRDCLTATPLLARFVLSLREDYLARLAELRDRIPNLLQNVFYLAGLSRQAALTAIRNPAEQAEVPFDEAVAEQILTDIESGAGPVAPPPIQIVCSRLFEGRNHPQIDAETYRRLGGAKEILRRYLGNELRNLGPDEADARRVLKAMVTSEGTKDVLTNAEVARRADLPEPRTSELLLHLRDRARLLRSVQQDRERRFELAHEYLTTDIWSWMSKQDLQRREVEELVARELRSWCRFRHLRLGVDRLKVFEANAGLLDTNEEALVLVLLSTVKHQRPAGPWTSLIARLGAEAQDRAVTQLFDYFHQRDLVQRREAAETIAHLDPAPVVRALTSPAASRRKAALEMLGGMELQSAASTVAALSRDVDQEVRIMACGALGEIQGPTAVAALLEAIKAEEPKLSAAAVAALGRTDDPRAAAEVKKALGSTNPSLVGAGQKAVEQSRSAGLIQALLKDSALPANARMALWDAIDRLPITRTGWVLDVVSDLSEADQQRLVAFLKQGFDVERGTLVAWSKSDGPMGLWALKRVKAAEESDKKTREAENRVTARLTKECSVDQVAELLANPDIESTWAVIRRLAGRKAEAKDLLAELLRDKRPRVRAGALDAIFVMGRDLGLLEPVLPKALDDKDPTVRYYACLAAAKHKQLGVVEQLGHLLGDSAVPSWYRSQIGLTVREAAAHALDLLRPLSKVWRKSFQKSFSGNNG